MIAGGARRRRALPRTALNTQTSVWHSPADAAHVGGDWADTFALSADAIVLTVGDVSGHGTEVAGAMAAVRASVLQAFASKYAPSQVLKTANDVAVRFGDGVVVTAIVAVLDHVRHTLTFANAGHPPPLMLTLDAHAFLASAPADLPLGIFPGYRAADYVVAVPRDALVVFYTDGITEHRHDPVAGEAELIAATRLVHGRSELNAACAIAAAVLETGRGNDDAAAVCLRTLPTLR